MDTIKCPFTFGTHMIQDFDPKEHHHSKMKWMNGKHKCEDLFFVFVKRGQIIKVGEIIERNLVPVDINQPNIDIRVYRSKDEFPKYTDGCDMVARLEVKIPPTSVSGKNEAKVKFQFGRYGMHVTAVNEYYHEEMVKYFDYYTDCQDEHTAVQWPDQFPAREYCVIQ